MNQPRLSSSRPLENMALFHQGLPPSVSLNFALPFVHAVQDRPGNVSPRHSKHSPNSRCLRSLESQIFKPPSGFRQKKLAPKACLNREAPCALNNVLPELWESCSRGNRVNTVWCSESSKPTAPKSLETQTPASPRQFVHCKILHFRGFNQVPL